LECGGRTPLWCVRLTTQSHFFLLDEWSNESGVVPPHIKARFAREPAECWG